MGKFSVQSSMSAYEFQRQASISSPPHPIIAKEKPPSQTVSQAPTSAKPLHSTVPPTPSPVRDLTQALAKIDAKFSQPDSAPVECQSRLERFKSFVSQKFDAMFGTTPEQAPDTPFLRAMTASVDLEGDENGFVMVSHSHSPYTEDIKEQIERPDGTTTHSDFVLINTVDLNQFDQHLSATLNGLAAHPPNVSLAPDDIKVNEHKLQALKQDLATIEGTFPKIAKEDQPGRQEKVERLKAKVAAFEQDIANCKAFNQMKSDIESLTSSGIAENDLSDIKLAGAKTKYKSARELFRKASALALKGSAATAKPQILHELAEKFKVLENNIHLSEQFNAHHAKGGHSVTGGMEICDRYLHETAPTAESYVTAVDDATQKLELAKKSLTEARSITLDAPQASFKTAKETKLQDQITELEAKIRSLQPPIVVVAAPPRDSDLAQVMATHNVVRQDQEDQAVAAAEEAKDKQVEAGKALEEKIQEMALQLAEQGLASAEPYAQELVSYLASKIPDLGQEEALTFAKSAVAQATNIAAQAILSAQGTGSAAVDAVRSLYSGSDDQTSGTSDVDDRHPVSNSAELGIGEALVQQASQWLAEGAEKLKNASEPIKAEGQALIQRGIAQIQQAQAYFEQQMQAAQTIAEDKLSEFEDQTGIKVTRDENAVVLTRGDENGEYQKLTISSEGAEFVMKQGEFLINGNSEGLTITHGDTEGDHQVITVNNGKAGFTFVQGDTEGTFGIEGDRRSGQASGQVSYQGTNWAATMGGRIEWRSTDKVLEDDSRTMHVRAKGVSATATVGGSVGIVGLSASIGGGYSTNTIFLRTVRAGETPEDVCRDYEEKSVPTEDTVMQNPVNALGQPGDTLIFSKNMNLSVGVGVSAMGFNVGVTAQGDNEMRLGIQRVDGEPPAFRVRLEPETSHKSLDVSAGWGPFVVSAGAGQASSVFYEFEMSASQVQDLMRTGKMPVIPNPKEYLVDGKNITPEDFKTFDRVNGNGIKLVSFGAAKGTELHVTADATVAKASYASETVREVFFTRDMATIESGHSKTTTTDAWFRGQQQNKIAHSGKVMATLTSAGQLIRTYEGLSASFKFSDTQTKRATLEERLSEMNALLGRDHTTKLTLPEEGDAFGQTETQVAVNLEPDQINRLSQLKMGADPDRDERNIRAIAFSTQLDPKVLSKLIDDLRNAQVTTQKHDPFMSLDQQRLQMRGDILGQFIQKHGLNGIAALDRLLDGKVAQFSSHSTVYHQKLEEIGVADLDITNTLGQTWNEFGQIATKQQELVALEAKVQASDNHLVSPTEKSALLKKITEQKKTLDVALARLLNDPERRSTIMDSLIDGADSSAVLTSIRNAIADRIGLVDHSVHIASAEELGRYLEIVMKKTLDETAASAVDPLRAEGARDEISGHLNKMLKIKGKTATTQILSFFRQAYTEQDLDRLLNLIKDEDLAALVPRLDESQKQELLRLCASTSKKDIVETAVEKDQQTIQEQVADLKAKITVLSASLGEKVQLSDAMGVKKTGDQLLEPYKAVMRKKPELMELQAQIQLDPRLSESDKIALLTQCKACESEMNLRMDLKTLDPTQKKQLFEKLMNPDGWFEYAGRASHALMNQMVELDKNNPQQLKDYLVSLVPNVKTEKTQVMHLLKLIEAGDENVLREALALFNPSQLAELTTTHEKTDLLKAKLLEQRDTIVQKLANVTKDQFSAQVGAPLKAVLDDVGITEEGAVEQLKDLLTESTPDALKAKISIADMVDQAVEQVKEKIDEKVTETLESKMGPAVDRSIERIGGAPGVSRETLLKMAVKVGDTDRAEQLRLLNEDYKKIHGDLTKWVGELKTVQANPTISEVDYCKAMARIKDRLLTVQAEMDAKIGQGNDDSAPLEALIGECKTPIKDFEERLNQFPQAKRHELLAQVVLEPSFWSSSGNDGSDHLAAALIDVGLKKGDLNKADLTILYRNPTAYSQAMFEILINTDQTFLLGAEVPTDKLVAMTQTLGLDQQTMLLNKMGALDYPTLSTEQQTKLNAVRSALTPEYPNLIQQYEALQLPADVTLGSMNVSDQIDYLKTGFDLHAQLNALKQKMEELGEAYHQPHLSKINEKLTQLEAKLKINLNTDQQTALFNQLAAGASGDAKRTKLIFNAMIEQAKDVNQMQILAGALFAGKVDLLPTQVADASQKLEALARQKDTFHTKSIILTYLKNPVKNAPAILEGLKLRSHYRHSERLVLFRELGIDDEVLLKLAQGLGDDKTKLLEVIGANSLDSLKNSAYNEVIKNSVNHQVELLRNTHPNYPQVAEQYSQLKPSLITRPKNLSAMTPNDQAAYLSERLSTLTTQLSQLQDLKKQFLAMDATHHQPHLSEIEEHIASLTRQTKLSGLNTTQKVALCSYISSTWYGFESTQAQYGVVLDALLDSSSQSLTETKQLAESLCAGKVEAFSQQTFHALEQLSRLEPHGKGKPTAQTSLENLQTSGKLATMVVKLSAEQLESLQKLARASGRRTHPVGITIQKAWDQKTTNYFPDIEVIGRYWEKADLAGMNPTGQIAYLKVRVEAMTKLKAREQILINDPSAQSIDANAQELNEIARVMQDLSDQTNLSALPIGKKQELCQTLMSNASGTAEKTKIILNHLIETTQGKPSEQQALAKIICATPSIELFREQIGKTLSFLVAADDRAALMTKLVANPNSQNLRERLITEASHDKQLLERYATVLHDNYSRCPTELLKTLDGLKPLGGSEVVRTMLNQMASTGFFNSDLDAWADLLKVNEPDIRRLKNLAGYVNSNQQALESIQKRMPA